ncbi:glutamate--cysteine ligase [Pseudovibrio sp. SPO723]|uniref:glutamate--cysteine ligase n=1 Tax=Nesiotobacter zosterae TaxID=392721 RepID=UPI0029C3E6DD|nr:glutamate--cysteine ligase [Pseudovibrio sp. SPO723]MDX5594353.1 glutamate--cysteine ligase [Pseudovibrio sp. SPO723]
MTTLAQNKWIGLCCDTVRNNLKKIRVGIEKESLRVASNGHIAQTEHPPKVGKALTNKHITTDFSEAQLEFITPAVSDMSAGIRFLKDLHAFTAQRLEAGEYFWNASMPPVISSDDEIPIASYGECNAARIKTLYRKGLANRYGKRMQTISGIHYNFSLPEELWQCMHVRMGVGVSLQDFRSDGYLALIRNLQRHGWLLLYLFGASPAVDISYLPEGSERLSLMGHDTLYGPYATSLRMSDIGYTSVVQGKLDIRFNNMEDYLDGLRAALGTSESLYEQIGVVEGDTYKQMNTHQLQLENELYGSVRPKRNALGDERPITALCRRGVEYVELRSIDINPFLPVGIDDEQANFLNLFLTFMAFADSPSINAEERKAYAQRTAVVAERGREPGLQLPGYQQQITLVEAARELFKGLQDMAVLFDEVHGGEAFGASVAAQLAKIENPELTPSAQVLEKVREYGSHQAFISAISEAQSSHFKVTPMDEVREADLSTQAKQSEVEWERLEAEDIAPFDQYLNAQAAYFCPPGCGKY